MPISRSVFIKPPRLSPVCLYYSTGTRQLSVMFPRALCFLGELGIMGMTEGMTVGRIVLYLAMSVDGYIADEQGGVSWLEGDGSKPDTSGSYPAFYETVEAIVMGWTTYHQIVTALSPDIWPYEGRPCYVVTHRQRENRENVCFWNGELTALADQLKTESKGNVWICGGASVARQLLKENRIDKLWLSVIPTVLGKGVRLFPGLHRELPLKLVATEHYNGIVDLVYEKR